MASSSSAPAPAPAPRISIGTAGYAYAHWRKDVFYPKFTPQDSELKYFSGLMSAVEINTTFHGLPRETTFENWKSGSRCCGGVGGPTAAAARRQRPRQRPALHGGLRG